MDYAQMMPKYFSWRICWLACSFPAHWFLELALLAGALRKRALLAINACGTILEYEFFSRIMYPSKQIQSIDCYQTFHDIFPKDCILWYTLITELCKVSSSMFWVLLRFHKHINFFFFLVIGDEILKGQTTDTNSHFLCKHLFTLGVKVKKV